MMRVLRENKDSLMAVLEAFVYDPLLNWRLIDGKKTWTRAHSLTHFMQRVPRTSPNLKQEE